MKRLSYILAVIFLLPVCADLWAHPAGKISADQAAQTDTVKKKKPKVAVYLGHSNISGGRISKQLFDSLAKQGLTAKDSLGNYYKVDGFLFTYAELNFYEDSVGTLTPMTDYRQEYCEGDTFTANVSATLYQRTKQGDTLYFDQVSLISPKGLPGAVGKSMKFEITAQP
jgi:hypothetical protein